MAKFQHGISINLQALDSIEIATDGNSALLGGGVYTAQVIEYLWKYGKVTRKLHIASEPHNES